MSITPATIMYTVEPYKTYLESKVSKSVVGNRLGYLRRLVEVTGSDLQVNKLTPGHMAVYFGLYTEPHQYGSYNGALQMLRDYLPWAVRNQWLATSKPFLLIGDRKTRKAKPQPRYILAKERFGEALETAARQSRRNRIAVATGLHTLARDSELCAVQIGNINLEKRTILAWREKGDDWITWPITPSYAAELVSYLGWLAEETHCASMEDMVRQHPDWYLCSQLKTYGSRVAVMPARRLGTSVPIIKQLFEDMGIVTRHGRSVQNLGIGEHTLRASGAVAELEYAEEEAERTGREDMVYQTILRIQQRLGHVELKTTFDYLGRERQRAKALKWYQEHDPYPVGGENSVNSQGAPNVIDFGARLSARRGNPGTLSARN